MMFKKLQSTLLLPFYEDLIVRNVMMYKSYDVQKITKHIIIVKHFLAFHRRGQSPHCSYLLLDVPLPSPGEDDGRGTGILLSSNV